jgi:hypothetical protein
LHRAQATHYEVKAGIDRCSFLCYWHLVNRRLWGIIGAATGIVLLQMVEQGLILIGVDVQLFQATIGLILMLAVISNIYLSRQ